VGVWKTPCCAGGGLTMRSMSKRPGGNLKPSAVKDHAVGRQQLRPADLPVSNGDLVAEGQQLTVTLAI